MSQKSGGPPPIVYILIVLIILGGGYWFLFRRQSQTQPAAVSENNPNTTAATGTPNSNSNTAPNTAPANIASLSNFQLPESIPNNTTVTIRGSTSLVAVNESLKTGFQSQFPGTQVVTSASGSSNGIQALLNGDADLAAVSRPLTPEEQNQGLVAVPIAKDAIALVVGVGNPYAQGLTAEQVVGIFSGQITNWSQIGGSDKPIRVLNRPPVSGTRQAFQEIVLNGGDFGNTPNITTLERDATTPMLRDLGDNGIGYATADQILGQTTVRPVAVNGLTPTAEQYPYTRTLYYVYQDPPSPTVSAFLGYVGSPQGQQAIANAGS